MVCYGKRIIFDKQTGKVLNGTFEELNGDFQEGLRPDEIDFIDLPFGDKTLQDADQYYVDVNTRKIVVVSKLVHAPTYEELENQLLLMQEGLFI